jgi:uncharacterized protein
MNQLLKYASLTILLFAGAASASSAGNVEPLPLVDVRWTDGFFHDRFELCRTKMVPGMMRLMTGTNYTQFLRNFELVAGLEKEGRVRGASFNDGDFYKFIEGATATLAVTNDEALKRRLDDIIAVVAQAQGTNGYLDTWMQWRLRATNSKVAPFRERNNWEVYNFGQLFTAASVHYRVTGQTNFLAVAKRAADCLDEVFQKPTPELALNDVCPSHFMGLMDLYRATGEPRYLALAQRMFAMRDLIKDGTADNQDRLPFVKQTEAEGHAVRANYLYAGAADLFLETGDTNLWKTLTAIWTNVTAKKLYITGGCGALYDGAAPDGASYQSGITKVHQSYGRNFQLPNTTAHNETCANIGNALWNWRMFLATGDAKYMDVVELELYNAIPAGGALDGTNYFYSNPLRVTDPLPTELRWSRTRVPFVSSFCCPPNLVRTLVESAQYAYAKLDDAIWVNLYGGSSLKTEFGGDEICIRQETEYPWSGRIRLKMVACGKKEFSLKLRIPGWAESASLRVNHAPVEAPVVSGSYVELHRSWKAGDVVELDLPMPVRMMAANPLVEETLNQVAFQRGPVVYCLESPDLPAGVKISDVRIPSNITLQARFDSHLLGGVVVLDGKVLTQLDQNWSGKLYREVRPENLQTAAVKFIPYAVWQNRGSSEMSVWLPRGN